jgi:hypothetical protein
LVGSEVRPWVDYCIPNIYEVQKIIGGGWKCYNHT